MSIRDEILVRVRAEPGIRSTTLHQQIGVSRDRLGHCLQRLRREGFIESTVRGQYIIAGSAPPENLVKVEVKEKPVKLIAIETSEPSERELPPAAEAKRTARYLPSTFIPPPSRDRLMSGR
jgi:hypothetical protein